MSKNWKQRREATQFKIQQQYSALLKEAGQDKTDMAESFIENEARVYTDPQRLELEREKIFTNMPLVAALSVDVLNPGDFLVFEEAGPSIVIVRTKSGEINAFLNICTHRGSKLVEGCGHAKRLSCPFHAWTFSLDGELIGVPGDKGFEGLDRSRKGLINVPVTEWGGLIFVIARPGEDAIDINAYLGDFAPELLQLEIDKVTPVKEGELRAQCNWKYALDTYGEGYHFATLHPETVNQISISDVAHYEPFGRHHRITFPPHSAREWVAKPEAEWPETNFEAVHFLFPNTVIFYGSLSEGLVVLQLFRLFPDKDESATLTRLAVYAPNDLVIQNSKVNTELLEQIATMGYEATAHVVLTEDYWVASNGWAQLKSAPDDFKVLYGANEPALQNMHKNFKQVLGL